VKSNVFPELITGRQDKWEQGRWLIEGGSTRRGQASCNLRDRVLEIPLEDSPTARVVRAHELMHARVSPFFEFLPDPLLEIDPKALTAADEFRINYLLGRIGFNIALLSDGSEKAGTRLVAQSGDWNEALCFLLAVLGTGAEREYFLGIRAGRKEWLSALRAVRKQALALADPVSTSKISDTSVGVDGVPVGYGEFVLPIARLVSKAMNSRPPRNKDESRIFERSIQPGARRAPSGKFADLRWTDALATEFVSRGRVSKKMRPSPIGTTMRYPARWVTDEQRRVFAKRVGHNGGVVVIDQSGSMDIAGEELQSLIRSAPGALVIGYSHKPGDLGNTPNAWILAQNGRVAIEPPTGNIGNGVDGPILEFAIKARVGREPIIWVCDGQVTDSNDHPDPELTRQVAKLVRKHGIRMVSKLSDVQSSLRGGGSNGQKLGDFGRVGRFLAGI